MKKLISFALIVVFLFSFINLSYADVNYEYKVLFKKIIPIDQIDNQPDYNIDVTIDGNEINIGNTITTSNPYCIIHMDYYIGDTLVYSGYLEKMLKKGLKILRVKVERQNEIGQYRSLYYWFYFMVSKYEIISTPTPTITNEPSLTPIITIPPTPGDDPTPSEIITPTISPILPSDTPDNFITSDNKNEPSKTIANNKILPKTGEEKPLFMIVSGGIIMLLGSLYLVAKLKK